VNSRRKSSEVSQTLPEITVSSSVSRPLPFPVGTRSRGILLVRSFRGIPGGDPHSISQWVNH